MRVRIANLALQGTDRSVNLGSGLNIVSGPITTGKTTTLRLIRMLLGSSVSALPAEIREHVPGIRGSLQLGDDRFQVYRPLVGTATARVEVAGEQSTWRLPASAPDHGAPETYADWLLSHLGLPRIQVPSAPTRADSSPTPVTINDYLNYCVLSDRDIDSMVFGHDDPFRNIKRRYVFQIIYGIYGIESAALQERYRQLSAERSRLGHSTESLSKLLEDTPWANRAALYQEIAETQRQLREVEGEEVDAAARAPLPDLAQELRAAVQDLERAFSTTSTALMHEETSAASLAKLANQLETQSSRLTRAIVAETRLLDFEFVVCPRCGSAVSDERGSEVSCRLCLQAPSRTDDRVYLVEEQNRIGLQLSETRELIRQHELAAAELRRRLNETAGRRRMLGEELDQRSSSYVSDAATQIADTASRRARTDERLRRLNDYATLFRRLDESLAEQGQLDAEMAAIEEQLAQQTARSDATERRIRRLEANFALVLNRFDLPRFADPPTVQIDRGTFLPKVDGRSFDTASQGMRVLINVAHALAHQITAIEEDLALPNILIVDALSSNLGHGGYDESVRERVYEFLIEMSEEHGDRLQIIVADNDVPEVAASKVCLELGREDMLVPNAGSGIQGEANLAT